MKTIASKGRGVAKEEKFDLCIIGAGPAGIAAADRARAAEASVILVEAGETGGASHNWGALPAHALAAAATRAHQIAHADDLGLGAGEPRVNFARINARLREVVLAASPDISTERLVAMGVAVIKGRARFTDPATVDVDGRAIKARKFLIATGTRPFLPPIPGIEGVEVLTPETMFEITRKPTHLIVVGAGATGLSLAQSHARLGAAVTVIDTHEPLNDCDRELAEAVLRRLEAEGVTIRSHTGVVRIGTEGEAVALDLKSGAQEDHIVGSHLLFATGRRSDFAALGLDATKIEMDADGPKLRPDGRTSNRNIAVAGEAAGHLGAHAARQSAEAAVEALLGLRRGRRGPVPRIVHTQPAIAQVGMTEGEARSRFGPRFAITRTRFAQTDAARALAEPHGHVKLLTRDNGVIVGAGLVGPFAAELVPVFALAIGLKLTPRDLDRLVFPYPAFGEVVNLLARDYALAHPTARGTGWRNPLNRLLP